MTGLLYLLFFCSGLSGLIYQVVWVRVFGNVFGNTVYSASLVIAVFMLGLGVGSYVVGRWADRRHAVRPESLLQHLRLFRAGHRLDGSGHLHAAASSRSGLGARVCPTLRDGERLVCPFDGLLSRPRSNRDRPAHANHDVDGRNADSAHPPSRRKRPRGREPPNRHPLRRQHRRRGAGLLSDGLPLVPAAGLRGAQMLAVLFNIVAAAGAFGLAPTR